MSRLHCPTIAMLLIATAVLMMRHRELPAGPGRDSRSAPNATNEMSSTMAGADSHADPRKSPRSETIKSSSDLLSEAREHFQAENYDSASAHADLALMVDPENKRARELLTEIDEINMSKFSATNSDADIRGYTRSRVHLGVQSTF